LNKRLAELIANRNYKAKVDEVHHINKKDAPSGTAITLAEGIINEGRQLTKWVNKPTDKDEELPIISLREEGVPGTHVVTYQGEHDEISISHKAYSRDGFAQGVLAVAEWVVVKGGRVGVFGMENFLGEL
jgi:4-hydroxy-tetrahydrodipicolinate reductase